METTQTVNLKAEALKNGAIWGVVNIILFLTFWYAMRDLTGGYWQSAIQFLVGIALAIFFCLDMRKKVGGYWSFKEALWPIFVTFLVSMAFIYVFTVVFSTVIDKTYPVYMKASIMEKSESMYKSIGFSEEQTSAALSKVEEATDRQLTPTFFQAIVGFGISAIFYFIGALIFAAIFKRNNPNPYGFATQEDFPVQ